MPLEFQKQNPVTALMDNLETGALRTDVLQEKVLSCILEFKTRTADMPAILNAIEEEARHLDTVVALGVAVRCDSKGNDPVQQQLQAMGYDAWRGKINMGLGKRTNPIPAEGEKGQ
jgi:hypothetical protein